MTASGKVYLVGAGPGDPELLTLKAHRLIREAGVVLHDDLVPSAIVALAGSGAEVVNVGKRCGAKRITQDEINTLMIGAARRGASVVRLKSGDPGIFGRLAEEMEALDAAGIPYEVVPGITAGIAAAASLSVSLTDRRKSARVVIVTGHKAYAGQKQQKIDWKSLAREDATLIVYMPGHEFSSIRQELLEAGLSRDVPAVIVSRATAPDQRHQFTTVGNLDTLPQLESPSILLMGWALEGAGEKSRAETVSRAIDCAELMLTSE
jgi:uroporphyrin-III C-methyltransferase / precorrin-2 dehydrogenase / sirohydrochlorin ferrochelatase